MGRPLLRATLAVTLSLIGVPARAQDGDAAALLQQGAALRGRGDDAAALAAFERAWALCRCEEAMAQRAFAEQAIGRWADAAEHIDTISPTSDDPWVRRFRSAIADARQVIEAHTGWLELQVSPSIARVTVSGRDRGASRRIRVVRGSIAVRVDAPGFVAETRVVRVAEHGPTRLEVSLLPEPPPQPAPVAMVPPPPPRVPHRPAPMIRPRYRAWVWATAVTAGISLAGGAVALWAREEAVSRYADPGCVTVFASRDERCGAYGDAVRMNEALVAAGFAVAGVAGVAAVVLAVIDARPRAERALGCSMDTAGIVGCGLRF